MTRIYTGIGSLKGGTLQISTPYKVTRELSRPEYVKNRQGDLVPIKGVSFEQIDIELPALTEERAAAFATVSSVVLTLKGGSQLPIAIIGTRIRLAATPVWTEDEQYQEAR